MSNVQDKCESKNGRTLKGPPPGKLFWDSRGLGRILFQKFQEHGNTVMQINPITEEENTFTDYFMKCKRLAINMKQIGLKPQDKILICTFNTLDSLLPLFASLFLGVIPLTLSPTRSVNEFKYFIKMMKPNTIFVSPEAIKRITTSLEEINFKIRIIVYGPSKVYQSLEAYLKPVEDEETFEPFDALSENDTAIILFSSGSTGKPKGICLSHSYFINITQTFHAKNDRVLYYVPPHSVSQIGMAISNVLFGFVKIVCPKYNNASNFSKIALKYELSIAFLPTPQLIEVTEFCKEHKIKLPLEYILIAGAPVYKQQLESAMETFPKAKISNSYGQTESGLITTYQRYQCDTKECREKLLKQSCGKPAQGVSLKVVDPMTEEMLGPHQRGEIMVCSRYLMNNYYGVPSTTSFDADGWFKSGDIGYYDEDDYIYIVDRVREVIKYKYNSMSPSFLEDILATHPAVKQVIVTGIPHEEDGDHPIAFIVAKEGVKIDPDEVHKFYNEKVDDKMRLRGGIKIIDTIPTTETGKPVRYPEEHGPYWKTVDIGENIQQSNKNCFWGTENL